MTETFKTILLEVDKQVATVTLNRPQVHNAFNDEMILELTEAFHQLDQENGARVVLLKGVGNPLSRKVPYPIPRGT